MSQVGTEVNELQKLYSGRNEAFASSFELLALTDKLATEGMESFVGNDPKTLWRMATFLLQPKPLVHKIHIPDGRSLTTEQAAAVLITENLFKRIWEARNVGNQRRGGDTFFWTIIGRLLATGWYAAPFGMQSEKFFVDTWEPETVYPEFSEDEDEGLVKLARVWTMGWSSAIRFVKKHGWNLGEIGTKANTGNVTFKQLWRLNENGQVEMGVDSGNNKMFQKIAIQPGLKRIPILVGAVAGLPLSGQRAFLQQGGNDLSKLKIPRNPQAVMGLSIMSTNEAIYNSFNRSVTFLMQLMRDTANPKTFEKTGGNKVIVANADEWFKRGAHFRMGHQDDLGIIQLPGIPVEIQQTLILMRNMAQRGGFSDATFGTAIEGMSSVLLAQSSEAAQQNLMTYHMAAEFMVSEISTEWLVEVLAHPRKYAKLMTVIEQTAIDVLQAELTDLSIRSSYAIRIPGDLAQRVNLAKFASPSWELSPESAYEFFFPEVPDGKIELERVAQSKAKQDPVFSEVKVIDALRTAAVEVQGSNPDLAILYRSVADIKFKQITGAGQGAGAPGVNGTGLAGNVLPSSVQEATGGTRGDRNGRT